ncbi:hypothetical protein [Rhodohalobacter sulfatireducens]|uniref:GlsB/YeaQ/YmgE family stress response membrane protein n=1 Tax=Rhodohalobacter sulfatireducens TaxID=2911366 RepID=A0ABS9KCK2_9BACT|nr:hypothetical protein [Rhodohalobacter sulfatireducens]MCG2588581.1 hypothetical protein [Rhodohalobacter sulfatireducens]
MEELNTVVIYWLISIGLLVGFLVDLAMIKRGIGMVGNVVWGAVGSVIIGVISIWFGLFAPLMYAAIGSIAFLFLFNVFSIHTSDQVDAKAS